MYDTIIEDIIPNIQVDVVYALPEHQYLYRIFLREGSSVFQAVHASRILQFCKEIDLKKNRVGIFNRLVNLQDQINDGDRVEIYRPLLIDPIESRRHHRIHRMNNRGRK